MIVKMVQEAFAGIGQVVFGEGDMQLTAVGLGSCIGVLIYDLQKPIAGLAHVMLPELDTDSRFAEQPLEAKLKFATVAIPHVIQTLLEKYHLQKHNLKAKIVGGAQMFPGLANSSANVGLRNQELVHEILHQEGIAIEAEEIGGTNGRSIRYDVLSKKLIIRSMKGEHEL